MSLRIAIVALVHTLILCGMIGMRQWTLATGVPVVLETQPVDPRSLFSGDYVRLGYKVSDLNLDELAGDKQFRRNETAYVVLTPDGEYWKPLSVHRSMPAVAQPQVVVKARVEYAADMMWDPAQNKSVGVRHLRVRYGIEDYFVREGSGRELERPKADEKISIRIAVDRFGNAGIKAVLVNGEPRFVETLF
jgi:uncharacterized membrane-anchored protein